MRTLVHAALLVAALRGVLSAGVGSSGLVELAVDEAPPMTMLHVRFSFANADDLAPWTFDASRVVLELGAWRAHPACANADARTLPGVLVGRGEHAVVDVYFALPARVPDLSQVAVRWAAGARVERTPLVIDWVEPSTPSLQAGWGGRWWCDPRVFPDAPTRVHVTSPASGPRVARSSQ